MELFNRTYEVQMAQAPQICWVLCCKCLKAVRLQPGPKLGRLASQDSSAMGVDRAAGAEASGFVVPCVVLAQCVGSPPGGFNLDKHLHIQYCFCPKYGPRFDTFRFAFSPPPFWLKMGRLSCSELPYASRGTASLLPQTEPARGPKLEFGALVGHLCRGFHTIRTIYGLLCSTSPGWAKWQFANTEA